MRASAQRGGFQVSYKRLGPEVYGVFRNRVFPLSWKERLRTVAITCNALEVSWNPDQQPEGTFPIVGTGTFVS